jgi:protein phosphatase
MSIRLRAAAVTDVGNVRDNNQDDLLIVDDALFVVADGMGGHVAGEVASREAVDAMRAAYEVPGSTDDLRQAVRLANGAVWQRGTDEPSYRGMGTTVTAVAVVEGDKLAIANVGDSRTYLMRDGGLLQLTQDHSFVQEAVRSGQLTQAQAESHPRRSQLTRALGVADDVEVDLDVVEPRTGDRLLLCSDGLWDEVGDELIGMVLSGRKDPEDAASELLRWAKEAGGRDNITVIVLDVVDGGETGRGAAASAVLDQAGDERRATSRADVATKALPAEDDSRPSSSPWDRPTGGGAAGGRTRDRALMQGGDGGSDPPAGRPRLITWRVLVFVVVLLGVLGAAALVVARGGAAWAVTLDGNSVVVKEGDQIRETKPLQADQLPLAIQTELRRGKRVADRAHADAYVDGITKEALAAGTLKLPGAGVVAPSSTGGVTPGTGAPATGPASTAAPVPGP